MQKLIFHLHLTQQTGSQFKKQYWEKINSSINADLNLKIKEYFPYSEHCHEATLALAYALHNTTKGKTLSLNYTFP